MATSLSLSELEEQLAAIRARRVELLSKPLKHSTGRSSYDNSGALKELRIEEQAIIACIRAEKIRLGLVCPAVREIF